MGFKVSGGFCLEKCGNVWKNGFFFGRLWPGWGLKG